jgi:hypothetical protein
MKTDDLINVIAEDAAVRGPSLPVRLAMALAIGGAVSAALFAAVLGLRPDIGTAVQTWRFDFKIVALLTAFAAAIWAALELVRPNASHGKVLAMMSLAPALLAAGVAGELLTVTADAWLPRAIGSNSLVCLVAIPLMAVAPLAGLLAVLRTGAPRSPALAGAAAGLLAGSLAALLYATHCVDDSPLFVAAWYTPAIASCMLLGLLAGRWRLRW